jgi:hypothetical protein
MESENLVSVSFSTCVVCEKCKGPTGIYENLYKGTGETYFHVRCVSGADTQNVTETKIVELHLTDDLNVKSEGR